MGLLGGVIGASIGMLVVVGMSAASTWTPVLDPWMPARAPLLGALIGLLSGTYPALRAATHGARRRAASRHMSPHHHERTDLMQPPLARGRRPRRAPAAIARLALRAGCGVPHRTRRRRPRRKSASSRRRHDRGSARLHARAWPPRQAGRELDRRVHEAEGFDYVPTDPFAQQAALTGKGEHERRGVRSSSATGSRRSTGAATRRPTRTRGSAEARRGRPRRLRPRAVRRQPGQTFALRGRHGDFTELGGCTQKATDEVFGGSRSSTLQRKLDELDDRIAEDQRMVRRSRSGPPACRTKASVTATPRTSTATSPKRFQAIVGRPRRPARPSPRTRA